MPDPGASTFRDDQQNLYDTSQFADPGFYPPGYHWRVDRGFSPRDVLAATAVPTGVPGNWSIDVTLNQVGAERFDADSLAASAAPPSSPQSRIAFFLGPRVVASPTVIAPDTGSHVEVGGMSREQAEATALKMAPCS
jgi:hypothetical protein